VIFFKIKGGDSTSGGVTCKLNKKIEIKDVLSHLFLLESNINIIDSSLSCRDDGYSNDLQTIN